MPSTNGIANIQPNQVYIFIRLYMIVIPIIFSLISFLIKRNYPINEERMKKLEIAIKKQNNLSVNFEQNYSYFYYNNPIYDVKEIHILPKTKEEKNTEFLAMTFSGEKYLKNLTEGNINSVFNYQKFGLVIWGIVIVVFVSLLVLTFKFLENSMLSLFPILFLMIIFFALAMIILFAIRFKDIKKYIDKKKEYSPTFMKLYLYQYLLSLKEKNNIIKQNCC